LAKVEWLKVVKYRQYIWNKTEIFNRKKSLEMLKFQGLCNDG
jgi:hypothetical protein